MSNLFGVFFGRKVRKVNMPLQVPRLDPGQSIQATTGHAIRRSVRGT